MLNPTYTTSTAVGACWNLVVALHSRISREYVQNSRVIGRSLSFLSLQPIQAIIILCPVRVRCAAPLGGRLLTGSGILQRIAMAMLSKIGTISDASNWPLVVGGRDCYTSVGNLSCIGMA